MATGLLFAEGFASLAIEMAALRMLVPVAGQSIAVTSIVVTVFLAALAAGYASGAERSGDPWRRTGGNMALAAAWSAFWLSHGGVAAYWAATSWAPPLWQVAGYAVLGVGPPAFWLAETVVVLVECRREGRAGAKAGRAFAASTLGNVAGGLGTALVVMRFAGMAGAVAAVVAVLGIGAVVAGRFRPRGVVAGGIVAAAVLAGVNVGVEGRSFERTTAHADYAVSRDAHGVRRLLVNGQAASVEDGRGGGHAYVEAIEDGIYARARTSPQRVLVVGAGGFTFGQGREGPVETVFVDVDPALEEVGAAFLAPARREGSYEVADGREFLLRDDGGWDAIVLDAYADQAAMPAHLYTREFLALARSRLAEDGVLYMNVVEGERPGEFGVRVERTLRSVFARCEAGRHGAAGSWHNRLYECGRHELDGEDVVYSDADTRGEVDAAALQW